MMNNSIPGQPQALQKSGRPVREALLALLFVTQLELSEFALSLTSLA
jgi:hypothetical protein